MIVFQSSRHIEKRPASTSAITAQQETLDTVTAKLASVEARVAVLEDDTDELFLGQTESDALFDYLSVDTDTNAINIVVGPYSSVSGGDYNTVSGAYSALLGGEEQSLSADYSTTPDP